MELITFLIAFPFFAALILACLRKPGILRNGVVFISSALIIAAVLYFSFTGLTSKTPLSFLTETHSIDFGMMIAELLLMVLIVVLSFKYKKYYVALLSVAQTGLM